MQAISAVDMALWNLKARLPEVSLGSMFGPVHDAPPVHGPGGFITLTGQKLAEQVEFWTEASCTAMKMKIRQDWVRPPIGTFTDDTSPRKGVSCDSARFDH